METTIQDVRALRPEQREAAERLLGRSLADLQNAVIRVVESGGEIVIQIFKNSQRPIQESKTGAWAVPTCFRVLNDLTVDQQADYDATISRPVSLSHPV